MIFGFVRMPIWPGENDSTRSMKAGEGGSGGPETREVRDTLPDTGPSLSSGFRFPGSLIVPGVDKGVYGNLGMVNWDEGDIKTYERLKRHPGSP